MVSVKFVSAEGEERSLDIAAGISVMEGAVRGGIDGIDADCGGEAACATCHVHVDQAWLSRLAPPEENERDMLEFAVDPDERSRLSCQIRLTPDLDGIVVHIPPTQR